MKFSENPSSLGIKEALALFIFSWQVLFLEVLFTRIFSFVLWHHFGFMAISVALLGFAGAGSWLSVKSRPPELRRTFFYVGIFSSLTVILGFIIISRIPFSVDSPWILIIQMLILYLLLLVPFFFLGLAIVLCFRIFTQTPGRVYFCNLLGSGLGALAVFWLLAPLGAERCLALGAGIVLLPSLFYSKNFKFSRLKILFPAMVVFLALVFPLQFFPFQPSNNKLLSSYLNISGTHLEFSKWLSPCRIDIVDTPKNVTIFKGALKIKGLFQDGHAPAMIFSPTQSSEPELLLNKSAWAVAYWPNFHPKKVLIIGLGGGMDLHVALHWGAEKVVGVEVNRGLVNLLKAKYNEFTGGIFLHPSAQLINQEGRHFLKSTDEKYDLIQLTGVDTFSELASGSFALVESYLYTVDAFKDFYQHLSPSGRICLIWYVLAPPTQNLRLSVLAIKALKELGIKKPAEHILALSHSGIFSLIIQKEPFNKTQIMQLKEWIKKQDWRIKVNAPLCEVFLKECYPEIIWPSEDNKYKPYVLLFKKSLEGKEDEFIRSYPYDITPVRDDNPYFFKYSLFQLVIPGSRILIGQIVVLAQILQGVILGLGLILFPAQRIRRKLKVSFSPGWYFFALGFGYLFIEIVLIQKLSLTLGHPFYAIGIVLPALLGFSGLGSWVWERLGGRFSRIPLLFLVGLLLIYLMVGDKILDLILPLSFPLRVLGALVYLFPLGFLMGIPFPMGLKFFAGGGQQILAWFWTVNGVCSVVASCVVVLISMHLGFSWVWALAMGFYLLAFLLVWRLKRTL